MSSPLPSQYQQNTLNLTIYITCTASSIVTIIIIACYLFYKRFRTTEFLMIVLTCLGDLIASVTLLIAIVVDEIYPLKLIDQASTGCTIQGMFVQFGGMLSFIWTANIAYASKMSIVWMTAGQRKKRIRLMFFLGFFLPVVFTLIPLCLDAFKLSMVPLSSIICQIQGGQNNPQGNYLLFFCFYFPLIFVIIFNTICMFQVVKACKLLTNDESMIKEVQHLLLYPIILVICWGSFLVLRILDSFGSPQLFSFQIFCYATSKLNGFLDGLAYGSNALRSLFQSSSEVQRSPSDSIDLSITVEKGQSLQVHVPSANVAP